MKRDVDIEYRLDQWVRWLCARESGGVGHCESAEWRYDAGHVYEGLQPRCTVPIAHLEALEVEIAIMHLPDRHREAIRLHYYATWVPMPARRRLLGVGTTQYYDLLKRAKIMLKNILEHPKKTARIS